MLEPFSCQHIRIFNSNLCRSFVHRFLKRCMKTVCKRNKKLGEKSQTMKYSVHIFYVLLSATFHFCIEITERFAYHDRGCIKETPEICSKNFFNGLFVHRFCASTVAWRNLGEIATELGINKTYAGFSERTCTRSKKRLFHSKWNIFFRNYTMSRVFISAVFCHHFQSFIRTEMLYGRIFLRRLMLN